MKRAAVTPEFTEFIPEGLQEGVLYVSERFKIAVHLCCCGCREEVVTPLTPADWRLIRDGTAVSLYPSIGNWGLRCQSHYWIRRNRIEWDRALTKRQIEQARKRDREDKDRHIASTNAAKLGQPGSTRPQVTATDTPRGGFAQALVATLNKFIGR